MPVTDEQVDAAPEVAADASAEKLQQEKEALTYDLQQIERRRAGVVETGLAGGRGVGDQAAAALALGLGVPVILFGEEPPPWAAIRRSSSRCRRTSRRRRTWRRGRCRWVTTGTTATGP